MKKNNIMKGVLLLIVLLILSLGFTGCGTTIITTTPTYTATGTVYVYTDSWDDYSIYMDGVYQGYSYYTSSYFVIYSVPVGYHTFSAYGWYYDGSSGTRYISSGSNYVTIYTW